ncbi:SDR family oxidoreductase [Streptomyces lonarensis]|uniref:NAD-dependent epimerase/dehydratase family protein n=1 Tax=Streptomyces lonarensis TaxID=700599 RepID=A0A7X6I053_9ACTN|nr:SDR family oxidoreductase [Streptomyces lonarensis]NJQ07286.1 NAD-dependent epimerase/dehydratase family protein [Streptomyces lonarensis]
MSRRPVVLLTGASGVVGQSLLREEAEVTLLAAARGPVEAGRAARVVRCDVSQPLLGLTADAHRALAAEVDAVVHSAGLTEWGRPAADYEPVNVEGTRHVAEFAAAAGATVHFMSTAFVAALLPGAPGGLTESNVTTPYVRSKLRAEQLLAESGVPHTVFRPTNLIGDAVTGRTSRGQIVQSISDWICRGRAPFVPVHAGNRIDVVPQDLLSIAVLRAVEQGVDSGEFWVTYGPEAMDMGEALRICTEHAAERGRTLTPVPVLDPEDPRAREVAGLSPMTRTYLSVLRDVSEVTRAGGGVLPTSMPELRDRFGVPKVADTEAYRATLRFAAGG